MSSTQNCSYELLFDNKNNIITNDCCTFCKEKIETIQVFFLGVLMFYPCGIFLVCYIQKNKKNVDFNVINILFGENSLNVGNRPVNYILLSTKQFIFICLKQNKIPNYVDLLHHLSFKYMIEKYASVEKLQHKKFEKCWLQWENFFFFFYKCITELYRGGICYEYY